MKLIWFGLWSEHILLAQIACPTFDPGFGIDPSRGGVRTSSRACPSHSCSPAIHRPILANWDTRDPSSSMPGFPTRGVQLADAHQGAEAGYQLHVLSGCCTQIMISLGMQCSDVPSQLLLASSSGSGASTVWCRTPLSQPPPMSANLMSVAQLWLSEFHDITPHIAKLGLAPYAVVENA